MYEYNDTIHEIPMASHNAKVCICLPVPSRYTITESAVEPQYSPQLVDRAMLKHQISFLHRMQ